MYLKRPNLARVMVCVVFIAAIALVGAVSKPALAQGSEGTISQATLQIWPEYDDPGLLIILSGSMTSDVQMPFEFVLPLPDAARDIQATINDPTQGMLLTQPWDRIDGALVYTLPQADFHVEYYLDRPPSGEKRDVTYTFVAPYDITELAISVQQPARSTDFTVSPSPDSSFVGNDGFTYFQISKLDVKGGDQIPIALSYSKTDQNVSSPAALDTSTQNTAPAANGQAASSGSGSPSWLPWLLIGIGGLSLLGLLAYWFIPTLRPRGATGAVRESTHSTPARTVRSTADAPQRSTITKTSTGGAAFCAACGRRFAPEDRFCSTCGAPRRP